MSVTSKSLLLAPAALLLASVSASAADIPFEAAPPPIVEAAGYNWSGFYVGLFGGISTGDTDLSIDFDDASGSIFDNSRLFETEDRGSGFLGGLQVGYDFQFNSFVLGAVADIAGTDFGSDRDTFDSFNDAGDDETTYELDYLGTVRGRLGYAFDRLLVYAHGGFAYGEVSIETSSDSTGLDEEFETDTKFGYVVGAGVEYAVTDHVSIQTEYSYTDLGEDDFDVSDEFARSFSNGFGTGDDVQGSEELDFHTLRAAVNFRF